MLQQELSPLAIQFTRSVGVVWTPVARSAAATIGLPSPVRLAAAHRASRECIADRALLAPLVRNGRSTILA